MLTQDQINQIVEELKQEAGVIAILVTGSYAYGTPTEKSDLDVRCLLAEGFDREEKERIRFGVPVELFFNTVERARFYMNLGEEEGHGAAIHFWAHGHVVHDPTGIAHQLQEEARKRWKAGRSDGKPWEVRKEKYQKYL